MDNESSRMNDPRGIQERLLLVKRNIGEYVKDHLLNHDKENTKKYIVRTRLLKHGLGFP